MIVARLLLCGKHLGFGEVSFGDAWLTGEGDCEGLVEHGCLSCLRGCETQEENLSEVEHEKHGFCSLTILE